MPRLLGHFKMWHFQTIWKFWGTILFSVVVLELVRLFLPPEFCISWKTSQKIQVKVSQNITITSKEDFGECVFRCYYVTWLRLTYLQCPRNLLPGGAEQNRMQQATKCSREDHWVAVNRRKPEPGFSSSEHQLAKSSFYPWREWLKILFCRVCHADIHTSA